MGLSKISHRIFGIPYDRWDAIHREFWRCHPALFYALSFLIGTSSILVAPFPFGYVWTLGWSLYLFKMKNYLQYVILASALFYGWTEKQEPISSPIGYFQIHSLQIHHSPFAKRFLYQGSFHAENKKIPCSIFYPYLPKRPKADCDYIVQGRWKSQDTARAIFQVVHWEKVAKSHRFAEARFCAKEKFSHLLKKLFPDQKVFSLFSALTTSELEDRTLRYEFSRLGLQHLLAISGFHFATLASFASFFLSFLLPYRTRQTFLLLFLFAYFLLIGPLPSVTRSWIMASLYLLSRLFKRNTTGLNLMGSALLIELFYHPYASQEIGFQLSFASCAAILFFFPFWKKKLLFFFPRHDRTSLTLPGQHFALVSSFLHQSLSLSLSINLVLFPLLLYHFHHFPCLSFWYNLFFPPLLAIVFFALLFVLLSSLCFPPLGAFLAKGLQFFTSQLLDLLSYPPSPLDFSLCSSSLPGELLPFYFFFLFGIILLTNRAVYSNMDPPCGDRSSVG